MGKSFKLFFVIFILLVVIGVYLQEKGEGDNLAEISYPEGKYSLEGEFESLAYSGEEEFTIVFIPDTQLYSESYPEIFTKQTEWIVENKEELNIKFVMHLGDIVQNVGEEKEWERASESMGVLDGEIPYLIVPGNHDIDEDLSYNTFNEYFPVSRFDYDWYGGSYPESENQNNYGFFLFNDEEFLVMGLDFCPNDEALNWANSVIEDNFDRKVILFTHLYLYLDGTRFGPGDGFSCESYPKCWKGSCNDGEAIWDKLVKKHDNVLLVGSAHTFPALENSKTDCVDGNYVHQTVQDFQDLEGGGTGWLRYYTFKTNEKIIESRAYSPYLAEFGNTKNNFHQNLL